MLQSVPREPRVHGSGNSRIDVLSLPRGPLPSGSAGKGAVMSILSRKRKAPADTAAAAAPQARPEPSAAAPQATPEPAAAAPQATPEPSGTTSAGPVSGTRTSAAWLGVCLAAVLLVLLIVFLLQNTNNIEVSFLWMHGRLPLAIALMIAAVGAALLTMIVGVARITQLRRRFRREHRTQPPTTP